MLYEVVRVGDQYFKVVAEAPPHPNNSWEYIVVRCDPNGANESRDLLYLPKGRLAEWSKATKAIDSTFIGVTGRRKVDE